MRWVIGICLLFSCHAKHITGQAPASAGPDFYLFVLAGQSNMAGRGIPDSLSKVTDPRILVLSKNNEWIPATDPLHYDKPEAGVGPGISFAQEMLKGYGDRPVKIGLIPAAVGGTSIDKWVPGAYDSITQTHPYDDAIRRTKTAMLTGVLKGILWHQGSSDAAPAKQIGYLQKQVTVINRFRDDLGVPQLPFVAGELGYYNANKLAFNQMLQQLPSQIAHVKVVSAEGLTPNADSIHFNTFSARILGLRYAKAMQSLLP
jgi:hypothetical protein